MVGVHLVQREMDLTPVPGHMSCHEFRENNPQPVEVLSLLLQLEAYLRNWGSKSIGALWVSTWK